MPSFMSTTLKSISSPIDLLLSFRTQRSTKECMPMVAYLICLAQHNRVFSDKFKRALSVKSFVFLCDERFSVQVFENARRSHAAADTHGNQPVTSTATFQFSDDTGGQFRAGASQRVPQRNCAAIRVDFR